MFSRYAIYYTPSALHPLAQFGAQWLGWNVAVGQPEPHFDVPDIDLADITATPRKYGFHATLKPPFRIADGNGEEDLRRSLQMFCAEHRPVVLDGLTVARLGKFLALVPKGDTGPLNALAGAIVQHFDEFRAPMTDAERARRLQAGLTPHQQDLLDRWGYPYVMDAFRFHMTLSGRLATDVADRVEEALSDMLADMPLAPFEIDALTLLGEAEDGRFHQIHRESLSG